MRRRCGRCCARWSCRGDERGGLEVADARGRICRTGSARYVWRQSGDFGISGIKTLETQMQADVADFTDPNLFLGIRAIRVIAFPIRVLMVLIRGIRLPSRDPDARR